MSYGITWGGRRVLPALVFALLCVAPGGLTAHADPIAIQPKMGAPVAGLTPEQLARFAAGKVQFDRDFTAAEGLGPIFNQNSCGACHIVPLGGAGTITVTRFGRSDRNGFDPLTELGGSLLQVEAISPECLETIPDVANVMAKRLTNSTLGFGLVEAIPDLDIQANADDPPAGVSGQVHIVHPLENSSVARVGRFGWKCQVATVLSFSADAALNEIGITNDLVMTENAPNGDEVLLAQCDSVPDPEDQPDGEGVTFIERVTDFQRFLAPPPQTPKSGMAGETIFNNIGCVSCHVSSFTTADNLLLEEPLRNRVIHPYSDFLLHDMGLLGDGIVQGDAQEREMRTAPLWGVRTRDPLLHHGEDAGGTFAERITIAIAAHDTFLSEGAASAAQFAALPPGQQQALIAFLDSLGRAEFDHNGDNFIRPDDFFSTVHTAFFDCFSGPGTFYTPDDACALSDIDQDGDVDLHDLSAFNRAFEGPP